MDNESETAESLRKIATNIVKNKLLKLRLRAIAQEAIDMAYNLEALVHHSSKWLHDSTLWESDEDLGPQWQAWREKMAAINKQLKDIK